MRLRPIKPCDIRSGSNGLLALSLNHSGQIRQSAAISKPLRNVKKRGKQKAQLEGFTTFSRLHAYKTVNKPTSKSIIYRPAVATIAQSDLFETKTSLNNYLLQEATGTTQLGKTLGINFNRQEDVSLNKIMDLDLMDKERINKEGKGKTIIYVSMEHGAVFSTTSEHDPDAPSSPISKLILVSSIAAGVQFGWALQLSLLTPYVQVLGVPHQWSSFIWLCGPLSGLIIQPIVGYYSDHCTSKYGRRRPYIVSGAVLVAFAVILIGFAADMGNILGDSLIERTKPRAVVLFVIGFWILDVANNTLQGPCRAFLADLSGNNHSKMSAANAFFSFFMAVGNVLGYAAGSYPRLYHIFPFTKTKACEPYCANLKTCFIFSVLLLTILTTLACSLVKETPLSSIEANKNGKELEGEESKLFFSQLGSALKNISKPMILLLAVTSLNWIGWFPFTLYDTDWMGREIYGGKADGTAIEAKLYDKGVSIGSLGLMLYAVTLGFMSLVIEPMARCLGDVKRVWGLGNFLLATCLLLTLVVTKMAKNARGSIPKPPPSDVKNLALAIFAVLGIPQAVTFSIPFALASIFSNASGAGQGLSLGLLNISICIPQMIVALIIGPLDAAFGGGNLPGFVMGAISATISGIFAFVLLPNSTRQQEN
ncbi:hypothetical protein ACSBR2_001700 [Camellia fascicularis]